MMHPDRKPGVTLVTDPPKRPATLLLRVREDYADALLLILGEHEDGSEGVVARHVSEAVREARAPRRVNMG